MITTILSQRSFSNSWVSLADTKGNNPIPHGVITDICVTCPEYLTDDDIVRSISGILIQLTVYPDDYIAVSLFAELAYDPTKLRILGSASELRTVGVPVALDCDAGVYASVLLGFIPKVTQATVYDACRVSEDLVVKHSLYVSEEHQYRQLELISVDANEIETHTTTAMRSDKTLKLSPEVSAGVEPLEDTGDSPKANVALSYNAAVVDSSALQLESTTLSQRRLIKVLGGIKAVVPKESIKLTITYQDELVPVCGVPSNDDAQMAILHTAGSAICEPAEEGEELLTVTPCDPIDPIDLYVGPHSFHEGVQVLDSIYVDGERDITKLFTRSYGWATSEILEKPTGCESLAQIDPKFDIDPEVEGPTLT